MNTFDRPISDAAVVLREVRPDDLDTLFVFHRDPVANRMAAFTHEDPDDRAAFDAWWGRLLANDGITKHTILFDGEIAGSVMTFVMEGQREVTYGIGRTFWGRGIATAALRRVLTLVDERPLYARAASDNVASLRVLAKCGFVVCGQGRGFAHARGEEIDELELRFDGDGAPLEPRFA